MKSFLAVVVAFVVYWTVVCSMVGLFCWCFSIVVTLRQATGVAVAILLVYIVKELFFHD